MILLAASLFFAHPAPLEMPKAEAYLVKERDGAIRLEDRYDTLDLWTSRAVVGRWEDDDGRQFMVARLDKVAPKFAEATATREEYGRNERPLDRRKDLDQRDDAISRLLPFEMPDQPARPRQMVRGFRDVLYYQGTNTSVLACAFLPDRPQAPWYLACWELLPGDDPEQAADRFESEFLGQWDACLQGNLRSEALLNDARAERAPKRSKTRLGERELLRADARHSVTNYLDWHVTEAPEFSVLDDLPPVVKFVPTLTNEFATMRRRYAEVVPTPIDGSNVLCVARIFKDRDEYLDTVGDELKWSAAYWCPSRRELVAYLPEGGARDLLKTIRHEAFHQYLSYATSMISVSPWFNEGYAVYFEDEEAAAWDLGEVEVNVDELAQALPALLLMDQSQFYDGSNLERRVKYRLAWSIARFIEKGAPEVRFQPFKDLKKRYVEALLKTHDMQKATAYAFVNKDNLDLFVREWKKFWKGE